MPSHFVHLLFAEEALRGALGGKAGDLLSAHGNLYRFGAQGPDLFYHNQRTMPTGLRYGVALHRHGYGSFVQRMVQEAQRLSLGPGSDLGAWILGFATHAPLDRAAHPFIIYFAGGADAQDKESRRLYHAHPFLERIIDVLVLQKRFGRTTADFDFLGKVHCGKTLPYNVIKAMVKGLNATYPQFGFKSRNRLRVENAYHDALGFYRLTNHLNPDLLKQATRRENAEGLYRKRLGLLHPKEIPAGYDYLNLGHASWCHPCSDTEVFTTSFLDLYESALARCIPILQAICAALAGQAGAEGVDTLVGNESLDTGREPCTALHSRPLPLGEILDELYRRLQAEAAEKPAG
jgi:hypothetical protein